MAFFIVSVGEGVISLHFMYRHPPGVALDRPDQPRQETTAGPRAARRP